MNNYSPINKLIIKDFRCLEDVQIDFSESPIVALVGENESGKTSILKAFEVCALHYNQRGQKDYIRDGAPFFGVVIQLSDNTTIIRMKSRDGINKYEVRYPDGTKWVTSKISEGLPLKVSEVMGMVEEPETKEYLQVRTYEDQLLLAYTPSSTNYKVIYDALKVGQITRAVRRGIEEANEIKSDTMVNYNSISALEKSVRKIKIIDTTSIEDIKVSIKDIINKVKKINEAVTMAKSLQEAKNNLGVLQLINTYNLTEINELKANMFINANNNLINIRSIENNISSLGEVMYLEEIDERIFAQLKTAVSTLHNTVSATDEMKKYEGLESMSEIDAGVADKLYASIGIKETLNNLNSKLDTCRNIVELDDVQPIVDIITKLNRAIEIKSQIISLLNGESNVQSEIDRLSNIIKEAGVHIEICPNCGTDIIVN